MITRDTSLKKRRSISVVGGIRVASDELIDALCSAYLKSSPNS